MFFLALVWGAPAHAQTYTWTGNFSNDWFLDANWSGGLAPSGGGAGDTLVFAGSSPFTATNDAGINPLPAVYLNKLTTGGTADVVLNANPPASFPNHTPLRFLGPSPGVTHASSGTLTFLTPVNVGSGQSVGLTVGAGAGQATFGQAGSDTGSFLIGTGSVSITNNSATTVKLGNLQNHFSGTLSLSGGNFQAARTTGDLFGNRVVVNVAAGASFNFNTIGSEFFGGLSGGGSVVLNGSNGYTFQSDSDLTFSGGVSGFTPGGVEKGGRSGNSTYTWTGDVAYTGGPAIVSNGTVKLIDGGRISATNGFTVRNGAALILDNTGSANNTNRLNDSAPVTLAGSLTLLGRDNTTTAEVIGGLTLDGTAASRVTVTPGAGGAATLTVASLSRGINRGAFVEFAGSGTVAVTAAPTLVGGILGYAVKGNDWATVSGGNVAALGSYQTGNNPTAWASTDNVAVGGALTGVVGTRTVNSLKITATNPIDIGGGNTLTLTAGGILAAESATIGNGTLLANQAANKEVVAFVAAGKTLTINSTVGDTGTQSLVKTGAGTLVLGGANAHSGGTFVYGGTLEASADANLGAAGFQVSIANATLRLTGNGSISTTRTLLLSGWNNTIEVTGTTTATFPTIITSNSSSSGGFTKTGTGTLIGSAGGIAGPVTVSAGTFRTTGSALSTESALTVASGAVADFSFNAVAENVATLAGAGELRYRDTTGLTIFADPTNPANTTFSGQIHSFQNGAAGSGTAGVTFGSPTATTGHGGTITLSGASDYLGPTTINLGTVRVTADVLAGLAGPLGKPSAIPTITLGNATTDNRTNAALLIGAPGVTIDRDIAVRDSSTANRSFGVITLGSDHATGSSIFSGAITIGKTIELTVAGTATTTFAGQISGANHGFAKVGSGTAVLSRTAGNVYTGTTYVAQGTLLGNNVTNSATGLGSVVVGGGGTFGGTGRVTGSVFVYPGGTVSPGSPASPFENLDLAGGSASVFYADSAIAIRVGTSPTTSSKLTVSSTGDLDLTHITTDSKLNITLTAAENLTFNTAYTVTVVDHTGSGFITYDGSGFEPNKFNVTASNFAVSGAGFTVTQGGGDKIVVSFTPVPVPEPGGVLALAAGAAVIVGLVRKRVRGRQPA